MRAFAAAELQAMRGTQAGAMMDTCTLRTLVVTQNALGEEIQTWTERGGVPCGLDVTGGTAANESQRQTGAITNIGAALRLSLTDGAGLTEKDAVTVTHRNGEPLTPPLTYHVDGQPRRGPTGYVLRLVEVR